MKLLLTAAALVALAGTAEAKVPFFNATCGSGIEVHADEGGPVYIGGQQANLKKVNNSYYEAKLGSTTISISINPDGSFDAMYTGAHGANGVCNVAAEESFSNDAGTCPPDVSQADRYKYPACN